AAFAPSRSDRALPGGGDGLLRGLFESGPLASLSLPARSHPGGAGPVADLCEGERALRRAGGERLPGRRPHLDPRLPPVPSAEAAAREVSFGEDRLLLAHPLPGDGGAAGPAVAKRALGGLARCRPRGL